MIRCVRDLYNLPSDVRYCKLCVVSNQRPRIVFDDEGVCNACRYAARKRSQIDWSEREMQLLELLGRHRRSDGRFDVIVPSSGGKDSAYVAHTLKYKYGMHPLTVTWSPNIYTEIGRKNYYKMIDAGFDNILGTPNGMVNRRMVRLCLEELGDPFQPFIYGQVLFPVKVALHYGVSLIMLGENGEVEYGGKPEAEDKRGFQVGEETDVWFSNYDISYWRKYFSEAELHYYSLPDRSSLARARIDRHFLGYYKRWVPQDNYYYCAQNIGFEPNPEGRSEGTYSKYASLDDKFDAFHYYFMLLKFGIGRATSDAAHEIRDGNITREEGVALVRRYDAEIPSRFFQEFLDYCSLTEREYWDIADSWRNRDLWEMAGNRWVLKQQVS